uniref:UDP-glycosyltransferase 83A1-like n=1 Tax=Erigeron canadensis TaxID=72917 RepID=UPI001CB918F8|nr:UDP-glycosyltransferase 83A1-like [Erigeron canadensis]
MAKPHVLLMPGPAQGHVVPMMELAQRLVKKGVKITFINTDFTHEAVTKNWFEKHGTCDDVLQMVSLPDGLEPGEDRNEFGKLMLSLQRFTSTKLNELIETINKDEDNKITCVIADCWMGWAIRVAKKMGIRGVAFCPASTATLATMMSVKQLIDDGIINNNGTPRNSELILLSETMPPIKPENLIWGCIGDSTDTKVHFEITVETMEAVRMTDWILCNSAVELELAAFGMFPQLVPIGPLLASNRLADQEGQFWQEDSSCLEWLDKQPPCSVIYVAFGSIANINPTQFQKLAIGLEHSNRPFLWVVWPSTTKETTNGYLNCYMDRVGSRGKIVSWAPQQKVLAHFSVACFMTHCGWNSTIEGVTNGVPFLCWPCFADQFYNETYICDIWKTGLGLTKDEAGIITRDEIASKVEQLLRDTKFKSKALDIKQKVATSVTKGGCSHENLSKFSEWIHNTDSNAKDQ